VQRQAVCGASCPHQRRVPGREQADAADERPVGKDVLEREVFEQGFAVDAACDFRAGKNGLGLRR